MTAVIIRLILRYGAGALIAKGILAPEIGIELSRDPDVAMVVQVLAGAVAAGAAEVSYYLAKRFGWRT